MSQTAIVVIAYNRVDSLKRLLKSLDNAHYSDDNVTLIISIDYSGNNAVGDAADDFIWVHGPKKVVKRETNMGLKSHVLTCGDYVNNYDSVILLEDDLYVSKGFYDYALQALDFTKDMDEIGGVSLYNHLLNVHVREPFEAIEDGYDNYYFQFASSWGQAYTRSQWNGFREWLKKHDGENLESDTMPANVSSWSDKSWLKYNIKYLIATGKYFLYPRVSLTSNFMEEGTHAKEPVADLQVPLMGVMNRPYNFSTVERSGAVYDAFFENTKLSEIIETQLQNNVENVKVGKIVVDLYGCKNLPDKFDVKYLLSSKSLPYMYVKSYGRWMRPIDENIIEDIEGDAFFLYDITGEGAAPTINNAAKYLYNYRTINKDEILEIIKYRLKRRKK